MKTILVATDFSSPAVNAANYAADMALAINADLFLLHVCDLPVSYNEIPAIVTEGEVMQDSEKNISILKENLIARTKGKINIQSEVCAGIFFLNLEQVCGRLKPWLVVMGAQGKSFLERLLFGGHAAHAMQNLKYPILAVPPEASFSAVKNIALACDFREVITTTPSSDIKELVNIFGATLHVVNTGSELDFNPEIVFQSGMLQEMFENIHPEYYFLTNKNTETGILDFVRGHQMDLLVVLPRQHDLLDKIVRKSHTKQLVLHSQIPVLALHQL